MNRRFRGVVKGLHGKYRRLRKAKPIKDGCHHEDMPMRGVYLFSKKGKHLYVGRTNALKRRYGRHTLPGMGHNSASFAFKLACKARRVALLARDRDQTRDELMANRAFKRAFNEAKAKIRQMEFRWVQEEDPVKQALLEAYCVIALKTPFNDFENH